MAKFRLYGNLENLVDEGPGLELDASTVEEGIRLLVERFPALASELLDEDGETNPYYSLLVNGQRVEFLQGLDTEIGEEDEVSIFPPIAA